MFKRSLQCVLIICCLVLGELGLGADSGVEQGPIVPPIQNGWEGFKAIVCGLILLFITTSSAIYYRYRIALTPVYEYRPFLWGMWQRRVVVRYTEGQPSFVVGGIVLGLGSLGFALGMVILILGLLRFSFTVNLTWATH